MEHIRSESIDTSTRNLVYSWPRLVSQWGWVGLMGVGYGIEEGGEYALGMLFLLVSAVSLVFVATHWEIKARPILTRAAQFIGILAAFLLLISSIAWTFEIKGNEPWSHLLPRHDYFVVINGGFVGSFPFNGTMRTEFYAKHNQDDSLITPITLGLYVRIDNKRQTTGRVVDLRLSAQGTDGSEVLLTEIPHNFVFYTVLGSRIEFPGEKFLTQELQDQAIGGLDSLYGLMFYVAPDSLSQLSGPIHFKIVLKDLTGRPQRAIFLNGPGGNLSPGDLQMHILTTPEDTKRWQIVNYADHPF